MDEAARQRELDRYRIVDSLPEAAFEDVVRLAAQVCGAQVAAVSMLDRDRQWFKSIVGAEISETARSEAFCNHAITTPTQLMEVPDARADPRFVNNALVTGGPAIRFYAGMPLTTATGATIGTLCIWDQSAKELTPAQRSGLQSLARLTMNLIEARFRDHEQQRADMLAPPPRPVFSGNFRVVILEVQNLAGEGARLGERGLERSLQRLQEHLEARLRPESPDTVDRVAGSGEIVALLHGDDTADALRELVAGLPDLVRETGLRVLAGSACSTSPGETLTEVFIRADEALTRVKDRGKPEATAS